MRGQPGHNTRPHIRLQSSLLDIDAWMTSQLNVGLISKLRGDVLGLFFDMLSMGICTTRHWQTSGPLVQELIVYTVYA